MSIASPTGLAFLRAELQTGLTLARIAQSAKDADKRNRNLLRAREAYEAVLHFMPTVILTLSQSNEIQSKLDRLGVPTCKTRVYPIAGDRNWPYWDRRPQCLVRRAALRIAA